MPSPTAMERGAIAAQAILDSHRAANNGNQCTAILLGIGLSSEHHSGSSAPDNMCMAKLMHSLCVCVCVCVHRGVS